MWRDLRVNHNSIDLATDGGNSGHALANSAARELERRSANGSNEGGSLPTSAWRCKSVSATELYANGSSDVLVTTVATLPTAPVTSLKRLPPLLTVRQVRVSVKYSRHLGGLSHRVS